jgi:hypothetical protein
MLNNTLTRAAAGLLMALTIVSTCGAADPTPRLDALWTDLASPDEAKATRAALALAASKDAVPFLKDHLKPVKADPKRLAQLIAQLDSDDFTNREAAAAELDYLGKFIKADLEKAVANKPSAEVKKRLQGFLDRIAGEAAIPGAPPAITGRSVGVSNNNGKITIIVDGKPLDLTPPAVPTPRMGWVRATRAVAVLEHVGSAEARKILEGVAEGEGEAPPTKAAKEALDRLKK